MSGLRVFQFKKVFPLLSVKRLSSPKKMLRIAASSVTTVMMMSELAVTSTKVCAAFAPTSSAKLVATSTTISKTGPVCSPRRASGAPCWHPCVPVRQIRSFDLSSSCKYVLPKVNNLSVGDWWFQSGNGRWERLCVFARFNFLVRINPRKFTIINI